MKLTLNIVLWSIIALVLGSVFAQSWFDQPWGLNATKGTSMIPTMQPDDAVLVLPCFSPVNSVDPGDIIVFQKIGSSMPTMHRVVAITEEGIITQGDNIAKTDQEMGISAVQWSEVKGFVPTIAAHPIAIPKIGKIADVTASSYRNYIIAGLVGVIVILGVTEARKKKRKRLVKPGLWQRHRITFIYAGIGVFSVLALMAFLMAAGYKSGTIPYEVSNSISGGVSWGSSSTGLNFGTLRVGTQKEEVVDKSNTFWLPIVNVYVCSDPNVTFSENPLVCQPGETKQMVITVTATGDNMGKHSAPTQIVTCPQLLPLSVITYLAGVSPILLLFVISLVPVLAIMLPFIIADRLMGSLSPEYRTHRRKWRLV